MQSIINTIKALDQCVSAAKEIKSGDDNTDFLDSMAYYIGNLKAWAGIVEEKPMSYNELNQLRESYKNKVYEITGKMKAMCSEFGNTTDDQVGNYIPKKKTFAERMAEMIGKTHEQHEAIKRCETNNPVLGLNCGNFTVNGEQVLSCLEIGDGNYQLLIGKTNDKDENSDRLKLIKKLDRIIKKAKNNPPKNIYETLCFTFECFAIAAKIYATTKTEWDLRTRNIKLINIKNGKEFELPKL